MTLATHVSLNVADLARAVAYYRALFGIEPSRRASDYAKFELAEPPLVLSLIPSPKGAGGHGINHLGLRLASLDRLDALQARLEALGLAVSREEGVECCYSKQTKFWSNDPDGTAWEVYVLQGEGSALGRTDAPTPPPAGEGANVVAPRTPQLFVHRLTDGVPGAIPHGDASLDEVLLEGSINLRLSAAQFAALLAEAYRALMPGGTLTVHGLVASRPLPAGAPLALPGPAAKVERVPVEAEPVTAAKAAGFVELQVAKLSERPHFVVSTVEMRELLLVGRKPASAPDDAVHTVVYRGPFASLVDDGGLVYERGKRAWIDGARHAALREGPAASQFVFLQRVDAAAPACDPADGCC